MSKAARSDRFHLALRPLEILVAEQSPLILALLSEIQKLITEIQQFRGEVQRRKNPTTRPTIDPIGIFQLAYLREKEDGSKIMRPGSQKPEKTKHLLADVTEIIHPRGCRPMPNSKARRHEPLYCDYGLCR